MRFRRSLFLSVVIAASALRCMAQDGIHVAPPKVYDDTYLQGQLNTLKGRLAALGGYDAATLTGKIGSVQGGQLQQSGFNLNLLGAPTPGVVTTVAAGAAAGTTPGTVTTQAPQTPAVPAAPTLGLALPAAFSLSSIDTLNEMTQLNY